MRQPTIRAIAARVGLNGSTVSRALRGDPRISEATRAKVSEVASQLGYVTNPLASDVMSHMRRGATSGWRGKIGWLCANRPAETDAIPWLRYTHQGARDRAAQAGFLMEDFWLNDPKLPGERLSDVLQARGIQGVIIPNDHPYLAGLQWDRFACATTLVSAVAPRIHIAGPDRMSAIRQSFFQLRRRGYERIGLMLHPFHDRTSQGMERAAFLLEMSAVPARRRVSILLLPTVATDPEYVACFGKWVHRHQPDVVICINEYVVDWSRTLGLDVPDRLGLMHLSRHPHLTQWAGIDPCDAEIGAAAADLVTRQLVHGESGIPISRKQVLITGVWVEGPTVRPA